MKRLKLMCFFLPAIVVLSACRDNPRYEFWNYEKVELVALINENEDLFNEVVRVLVEDDNICEKGSHPYEKEVRFTSPHDEEIGLLDQHGQQVVGDFFQFHPYMVRYDYQQGFVKITFIGDIDTVESYTFMYWLHTEDTEGLDHYLFYIGQDFTLCSDAIPEGWYMYHN